MRAFAIAVLSACMLRAQGPLPVVTWTAPGKGNLQLRITRAPTVPAPFVLIAGDGDPAAELAQAIAARGITAVQLVDATVHTLPAAAGLLRQFAGELELDAARSAFVAVGDGAEAAMHLVHETGAAGAGLVMLGTWAPVIEGLRADMPLLVVAGRDADERTRLGQRELAHQSALAGAPVTAVEAADVVASAARFLAARLRPPPYEGADVSDDEAWQFALAAADRGDPTAALRWLDRAIAKEPRRAADLAADHGFARIRTGQPFRDYVRTRAPIGALQLVPPAEAGQAIAVRCRFVGPVGEPLAGVIVDAWQTDALGLYDHRRDVDAPRLFGSVRTDADGCFVLHSVRPGGYPRTMIPCHVHLLVHGERKREVELMFRDDARLSAVHAERLIARGYGVVDVDEEGRGTAAFVLPDGR